MATNNTMAVFSKLEKFNGKGDLKSWFQKFNRCCTIAQKTEDDIKGQVIMLCLEGQALAVAEQLEYERDGLQTFNNVKTRLESVFDTSAGRELRMQEFENRMQRVDESEDEFMLELVQLYRSANPQVPDAEFQKAIKRKFLQGISPDLRRAIYVFNNDPHSVIVSYQRLLEYARNAKLNVVDTTQDVSSSAVNAVQLPTSSTAQPVQPVDPNAELLQAMTQLTCALNENRELQCGNGADGASVNAVSNNRYQRRPPRGGANRNSGRFQGSRGRSFQPSSRQQNNAPSQGNEIRCHKCNGLNHKARFCLQKN